MGPASEVTDIAYFGERAFVHQNYILMQKITILTSVGKSSLIDPITN